MVPYGRLYPQNTTSKYDLSPSYLTVKLINITNSSIFLSSLIGGSRIVGAYREILI
jgi:hypothetical protein